jgi:hypothetical protein
MASPLPSEKQTPAPDRLSLEARQKVRKLQGRANRGLWAMALFIGISLGAMRDFDFLPPLPAKIHALLGASPPVSLISAALIVYSFSAIILILTRMATGSGDYTGMMHVGYLLGFYVFYHFAGAMEDNFWAVFAAGMTILSIESYHIRTYHMDLVRELEQVLPRLEKKDES